MGIRISVIIPTFNRAHLISETIDSIIFQSYQPEEIIVVDDGSTDETERVINKYDGKVQYVKIENSGVCRARNIGADMANCDWIAFCDSDDLWQREKLFRQVELIRRAPQVEYCFTNFRNVARGLWSSNVKFDDAPNGYWDIPRVDVTPNSFVIINPFYSNVLRFQPIFQSTIMMTKSFFNRIGKYNESFGRKMSEDFEFTLRCVQEKPIGVIKEPVVGIRWHDQNFSKGKMKGVSFVIGDIDILKYSLKNHRMGSQFESLIEEQIIRRSIVVANGSFSHGEFKIMKNMLSNIPSNRRSVKLWTKSAIARLPYPMAKSIQKLIGSDEK